MSAVSHKPSCLQPLFMSTKLSYFMFRDSYHPLTQIDSKSRNECRDVYRTIRSSKINDDIYASQALQVTEKDGRFNVSI